MFGRYRPAHAARWTPRSSSGRGRARWQTVERAAHERERLRACCAEASGGPGAFRIAFGTGDGTVRTRAARVGVSR